MRKKKVVSKSGLFILMLTFFGVVYYFFNMDKIIASTVIESGDFRMKSENKWDGKDKKNYASLSWDSLTELSQSGYQLYQYDQLTKEWTKQSLNYGKQIRVLNVYPNVSGSRTLKSWMDGLQLKDKNGNNLIQVTEVAISSFNSNSVSLLKDSNGNYLYDVIMFGSWDSNNGQDISSSAYDTVKAFSNTGRGVLFGHDTIYGKTNFQKFADSLGIVKDTSDRRFGGPNVQVVNNGYLLKYPFELKNDAILSIPAAHAGYKVDQSIATVWLKFVSPFTLWPTQRYNSGNYTNEWYLITNKNLAMIQTGHSSGSSTLDERKIIANTLYNLAQVSVDKFADDYTVQDDQAPSLAEIKLKTSDDPTNITLEINSEDQGREYQWYVIGKTKYDGDKKSDTVKETITSNIAGYKYVIDNSKESTLKQQTESLKDDYGRIDYSKYDKLVAPIGTTDTTSPTYDAKKDANLTTYDTAFTIDHINAFTDLNKYLHVVSVDRANNVSEVKTVQIKDLLTKFYVVEKYQDVDNNQLAADSMSVITKNERYSHPAQAIAGYEAVQYQIEEDGKSTSFSDKTATIDKVTNNYTVTYYYKKIIQLNLRQVLLSENAELPIPKTGYITLTQKNASTTYSKIGTEVYSSIDGSSQSFSKLLILKEKGAVQVMIDTVLPEYYQYAGYITSTTDSLHESQNKLATRASVTLDANNKNYWVTVYSEPSIGKSISPTLYNWDYKKNNLGTINRK